MTGVKFTDNSKAFLDELERRKQLALKAIGMTAETHAKKLCPVDTGRLRNSISHTNDEDTAYIGTNVEYAPYIELGTSRTKAQPFLKPAILDNIDEYKQIVSSIMKE